jgi:hypothetical protein
MTCADTAKSRGLGLLAIAIGAVGADMIGPAASRPATRGCDSGGSDDGNTHARLRLRLRHSRGDAELGADIRWSAPTTAGQVAA